MFIRRVKFQGSREELMKKLEKSIQYSFKDPLLMRLALTHRSLTSDSNERLEFLGDAVFNLVISDYLYVKYPRVKEGRLSRIRAQIISKPTLQKIANKISVADYIRVGPAEQKTFSNKSRKTSIVSDAVEAIIGAIYLDGGMEAARSSVLSLFKDELENIDVDKMYKDAKTRLQELVQSEYHSVPEYKLKSQRMKDPQNQEFMIYCTVPHHEEAFTGMGSNRKEAEQAAAQAALAILAKSSVSVE